MDYEFRILMAEKELAHLKEMHNLTRSRVDALQDSTEASIARFERIEHNLAVTAENIAVVTANIKIISENMRQLIAALLREHPNGHS